MKDQHIGFQIVGYPDERGLGTPVIIAGAELGRRKVMEAWAAIKPGHRFPKGIKLAMLEQRLEADKAIFINDSIAAEQEAAIELRNSQAKAAEQKKIAEAKAKKQAADADQSVREKAVARDAANFELTSAKNDRDNAKANATETETHILTEPNKKLFAKRLKEAEERLEKATKAFADADQAWKDAKDARAKLNADNLPA